MFRFLHTAYAAVADPACGASQNFGGLERLKRDRSCPPWMKTNTSTMAAIGSPAFGLWRASYSKNRCKSLQIRGAAFWCSMENEVHGDSRLFPFSYRGLRRNSFVTNIFPPFSHGKSSLVICGGSTVTRLEAPFRPVAAVQKTTAHFLSVCRCKAGDYLTRSSGKSGFQSDAEPRERPQKWCPGDTTLNRQMCYAYQSESRRVPQIAKKCSQELTWNK